MIADALDSKSYSLSDDSSLADMLVVFRRGATMVDAALSTLVSLSPKIEALKALITLKVPQASIIPEVSQVVSSLGIMLNAAGIEGDNLLLAPKGRTADQPFVVFTLARQVAGTLSVQFIEIDRAAIALSDGDNRDSMLAYDCLFRVGLDMANLQTEKPLDALRAALDAFRSRINFSASRLSIAKARFDLQSSFLNAITKADKLSSTVRLESPLSRAGARDIAMETSRLLSRQTMNMANGNRETLRNLLAKHVVAPV